MGIKLLKHSSFKFSHSILAVVFMLCYANLTNAQTGTWTAVRNLAPDQNMGVMLLLTDGTVIAHDTAGGGSGTGWDKLTPDSTGSYVNGTWSRIASMNYDRLFFASQVLPSGKVFVSGGEYGAGDTNGEIYDPIANTWTMADTIPGQEDVYDGNSEILPNGNILVGPQAGPNNSTDNLIYSPASNKWSVAPLSPLNHDEAAWLKLADSSILFVGISTEHSCRYVPKYNRWFMDATVPDSLYDLYGGEAGAAFMLPNGKAIFFGARGQNAYYTPSGDTMPGTWSLAPPLPLIGGVQLATPDAAATMMSNGRILLALSPIGTWVNEFNPPTYFYEFDYNTSLFTQVTANFPGSGMDSLQGIASYQTCMLALPDGNILLGINQDTSSMRYWVYTPATGPIAAGKPTINSIYQTSCGSNYYITGKEFNGISEGASYGDDWQMATNYPLVRLNNGSKVYYAKTSNWNRIGAVQTDSLEDTAQFTLPAMLPIGTYSLTIVVNGIASNPIVFSPFKVSDSVLANVKCNGSNTGNAKAIIIGGSVPYTYKWANGSGNVSTSATTGPVLTAGTYTLTVTDGAGCTLTAGLSITQPNALSVTASEHPATSGCNGSAWITVSGGISPYTYSWHPGNATTDTIKTLCAGSYCCHVTDKNGCIDSSCVNVLTGIGTVSNNFAIKIYPNPSKGYFTLTDLAAGEVIEVYDYLGQKINVFNVLSTTMQIDISGKADGLYFLRILSKDGSVIIQDRIIKAN
jgi:hypothetical protein